MLSNEDQRSTDILEKMKVLGVHERTVRTAVQELGVVAYRKNRRWYWQLPEENAEADDEE